MMEADSATVRTVDLKPSAYFNWRQSLRLLKDSGADDLLDQIDVEAGTLQRPVVLSDGIYMLLLAAEDRQDAAEPEKTASMRLTLQADDEHEGVIPDRAMREAEEWANRRFQLDLDMEEVRTVLSATGAGSLLVEHYWPERPAHLAGAWEGLLKTIIGNQIFPGLSRKLQQGLMLSYGAKVSFSGAPIYLYPTPEQLAVADPELLLSLRFSRQKAHALPRLAQMILEQPEVYDWQRLREARPEDAVEVLDALPGVGPWTAQYVVMRGLPHNDYFLTYGNDIKQTLVRLWGVRGPLSDVDAQRLVAAWSPYRRVACYYTYEFMFETRDLPLDMH